MNFQLKYNKFKYKNIPKKPKPHRLGRLIQFSELGGGLFVCMCVLLLHGGGFFFIMDY